MTTEKALSDKGKTTITLPSGELIAFGFKIFKGEDVNHDVERLKEKLLSSNTKSKGYIETSDFKYWINEIFGDLK